MRLEMITITVHDRVAGLDGNPRYVFTEAHAKRDFKRAINMPSDSMLFHNPGDFDLVKVGEVYRNDDNNIVVMHCEREVLATGTSCVDQVQRQGYAQIAASAIEKESMPHAPQ